MKIVKDVPFGYEYSKKFNIGDLVEWTGWDYDGNGDVIHNKSFGIIISMAPEECSGRSSMFAKVYPAGGGEAIKFIVFVLRKRQEK
tara:strand:- start:279 stop:536 length:258 start_codon:yes stop_codon:yes gene_type:complete